MRLFPEDRVQSLLDEGLWLDETWGDRLRSNVAQFGDQIAVVDAPNKMSFMAQEQRRTTWAELDRGAARCAQVFYEGGIREGDVVGIQIPNCVELVITYLALNRLGAILSPYPMPYRRHELLQLAQIAGVNHFVTTAGYAARDLPSEIASVIEELDTVEAQFVWHGADTERTTRVDLDRCLSPDVGAVTMAETYIDSLSPHVNDCVLIMFTSGTTGVPKGVPRAHGDTLFGGITNASHPRLTSQSVILNPMPMVNAGSIGGIFMPWLVVGCTLVQHQPFDLEVFVQQVATERVTYTVVAPTTLNDMASDPDIFVRNDLSSLRTVGAGSAPLSGWSIDFWESKQNVEIINFFGATEGIQLTADSDTVPDPTMRGRCLPVPRSDRFAWRQPIERQSRIRLVDVDTDVDITEPGHPGELRFISPSTFAGYLHGVDEPFDDQGFFRTGDIFEFSAEEPDMLLHVDRKKDLIIRGGLNISAAEVETMLSGHPQIAEVAAVGRKDRRLGERTCVFVVPRIPGDPPTLDSVVAYLRDQDVATFKLPEFIEIVDELPRNPSGKVLKRELRTQINGVASVV